MLLHTLAVVNDPASGTGQRSNVKTAVIRTGFWSI